MPKFKERIEGREMVEFCVLACLWRQGYLMVLKPPWNPTEICLFLISEPKKIE